MPPPSMSLMSSMPSYSAPSSLATSALISAISAASKASNGITRSSGWPRASYVVFDPRGCSALPPLPMPTPIPLPPLAAIVAAVGSDAMSDVIEPMDMVCSSRSRRSGTSSRSSFSNGSSVASPSSASSGSNGRCAGSDSSRLPPSDMALVCGRSS